ncbi:MAG TPA: hypothetical protein PLP48_00115 [Acholeplasmataceae bacterium]|nr:hypothetical protein [Acholeplasmataceae bacterium]
MSSINKLVMVLYGDLSTDARVKRSAKALCSSFDVEVFNLFSTDNLEHYKKVPIFYKKKSFGGLTYLSYILKIFPRLLKNDYSIYYGHDIFSTIPLFFVSIIKRKKKFIYDAHELYISDLKNSFKNKILLVFQKLYMKKCDLIIAASEERSKIMQKEFSLEIKPLVIRNISFLPQNNNEGYQLLSEKHKDFFKIPAFSIIYAGVMVKGRNLDILINVVNKLGSEFKLLLLGNGDAYGKLEAVIQTLNNKNIIIDNAVPYEHLGSVVNKFDVGYMYYGNDTLNNIYCAPNKVYEYASANLPILCNLNPTIFNLFQEYPIGISSDDIYNSLLEIKSKPEKFKKNITIFIQNNSWGGDVEILQKTIKHLIKKDSINEKN